MAGATSVLRGGFGAFAPAGPPGDAGWSRAAGVDALRRTMDAREIPYDSGGGPILLPGTALPVAVVLANTPRVGWRQVFGRTVRLLFLRARAAVARAAGAVDEPVAIPGRPPPPPPTPYETGTSRPNPRTNQTRRVHFAPGWSPTFEIPVPAMPVPPRAPRPAPCAPPPLSAGAPVRSPAAPLPLAACTGFRCRLPIRSPWLISEKDREDPKRIEKNNISKTKAGSSARPASSPAARLAPPQDLSSATSWPEFLAAFAREGGRDLSREGFLYDAKPAEGLPGAGFMPWCLKTHPHVRISQVVEPTLPSSPFPLRVTLR